MLILSRKIGEKMVINDNIVIEILSIKGCQVRLGTTAPKEIRVDREEIKKRRDRDMVAQHLSAE